MRARIDFFFAELEQKARYQYVALGLITLLAAFLRFYKLGEWSFWIDELYTIGHAQAHYSSLEATIRNIPPSRNWVPISLMLTAGALNTLGTSEWSARLAPALIGILSIPVLYFPVKRMFSPLTGLIAALLLAVSPWHLYWSQNARFYTSMLLFYSLALFVFFFAFERDRIGSILLCGLLLYLATSERLFALLIAPVWICYLAALKVLPFDTPVGLKVRNLLLLSLPGIAGGITEIYGLATTGHSRFFGDFGWFFLYPSGNPLRMLSFIGYQVGLPLMALAFFGGLRLLLQKNRAGLLLFIGAVLPVLLIALLNPFIFTKPRYTFVALSSWIILASVGIGELMSRTKGSARVLAIGVLVALLADAGGANLMYYQVNNGNRRDWRGAFALVQERSKGDDVVVAYWPEFGDFYSDREIVAWEDIDPETVVQSGKRYWFVLDSETIYANAEMKAWVERQAELIDVRYLRTPDDFSLHVYLYDHE